LLGPGLWGLRDSVRAVYTSYLSGRKMLGCLTERLEVVGRGASGEVALGR